MISCFLQGGLGNMMFQIATTYAIALDNNDECFFDFIKHANMQRMQSRPATTYATNIFSKLKQGDLPVKNHFNETSLRYNPISYRENLYLNGYFYSEKYFVKRKKEIVDLFNFDFKHDGDFSNYTSLHIRRGDYVWNQHAHNLQPVEYYIEAMEKCNTEKYVVFSDDIEWCRKMFIGDKFIFVSNEDFNELFLMASCKNNIIANSSFSWWGAWLNKNENKKVFAPKKWVNNGLYTDDIYCEGWIKI